MIKLLQGAWTTDWGPMAVIGATVRDTHGDSAPLSVAADGKVELLFAGCLWRSKFVDSDHILWEGEGGTWVRVPSSAGAAMTAACQDLQGEAEHRRSPTAPWSPHKPGTPQSRQAAAPSLRHHADPSVPRTSFLEAKLDQLANSVWQTHAQFDELAGGKAGPCQSLAGSGSPHMQFPQPPAVAPVLRHHADPSIAHTAFLEARLDQLTDTVLNMQKQFEQLAERKARRRQPAKEGPPLYPQQLPGPMPVAWNDDIPHAAPLDLSQHHGAREAAMRARFNLNRSSGSDRGSAF